MRRRNSLGDVLLRREQGIPQPVFHGRWYRVGVACLVVWLRDDYQDMVPDPVGQEDCGEECVPQTPANYTITVQSEG